MSEEPIQELILPGVVDEPSTTKPRAVPEDEENLDDVEETLSERLYGLTEMFPPALVDWTGRGCVWSYWLVRRCAWVGLTSLAILALPPFIEQQRLEFEEMQNMQKKQLMLGQGAGVPQQPLTLPPSQR